MKEKFTRIKVSFPEARHPQTYSSCKRYIPLSTMSFVSTSMLTLDMSILRSSSNYDWQVMIICEYTLVHGKATMLAIIMCDHFSSSLPCSNKYQQCSGVLHSPLASLAVCQFARLPWHVPACIPAFASISPPFGNSRVLPIHTNKSSQEKKRVGVLLVRSAPRAVFAEDNKRKKDNRK